MHVSLFSKTIICSVLASMLITLSLIWLVGYEHHQAPSAEMLNPHQHDEAFQRVLRTGTIRCGYFLWPPYMARNPQTKALEGVNYDYMMALGRFLNLKIDWVQEVAVGEVSQALQDNKFDVMCATMWPGAAIRELDYTDPMLFTDVYAYVRGNDTRFDQDLQKVNQPHVRAVVLDGDTSVDIVRTDFPQATPFTLSRVDDGIAQIVALTSNQADVAFLDKSFADSYLQKHPNAIKLVAGVPPVRRYGEHFTINKGNNGLKHLLDVAILTINNSALGAQIFDKYPGLQSHRVAPAWVE
jgi:ABC-type amino acid transport substrate-binding protein